VSKRRESARVELPTQFRASYQPRLGSIPRSPKMQRGVSRMLKKIMKDLAQILQGVVETVKTKTCSIINDIYVFVKNAIFS
jgi:hypothetical protein